MPRGPSSYAEASEDTPASNGLRVARHPKLVRAQGGGGDRNRTDDLMLAKHALSQLSYAPSRAGQPADALLVGQGRLELPTSRLSSARSNQLSYWPAKSGASPARPAGSTEPARAKRTCLYSLSFILEGIRRRRTRAFRLKGPVLAMAFL